MANLPFDSKHDAVLAAIQAIDDKIVGVHRRLDTLNGSVARHEKAINENAAANDHDHTELFHVTGDLLKDLNDRKAEARKKKEMLWERLLWVIGSLLLAYLVKHI